MGDASNVNLYGYATKEPKNGKAELCAADFTIQSNAASVNDGVDARSYILFKVEEQTRSSVEFSTFLKFVKTVASNLHLGPCVCVEPCCAVPGLWRRTTEGRNGGIAGVGK